ncbi:hypothetical protein EJB05_33752, partial [Eragrostis curvula]
MGSPRSCMLGSRVLDCMPPGLIGFFHSTYVKEMNAGKNSRRLALVVVYRCGVRHMEMEAENQDRVVSCGHAEMESEDRLPKRRLLFASSDASKSAVLQKKGSSRPAVGYVAEEDADALDCGVCFLPLKPPIFQCEVGHVVCSSCRDSLAAAGKCHPLGRAITVFWINPNADASYNCGQGGSSKKMKFELSYSRHGEMTADQLIANYDQSSKFVVATCTDLSDGLPSLDGCVQFIVLDSVVAHSDRDAIEVKARVVF